MPASKLETNTCKFLKHLWNGVWHRYSGFPNSSNFLSFYNVVHSNRLNQVLVHNKTINSQTAIFLHHWSKMISFIRQLFRASSDFFRMNVQHISAWVLRCDRWLQWTQITYWIRSILRLPQKGAGWNRG